MNFLARIRSRLDLRRADRAYARGDLARAHEAYRALATAFDETTRVRILNRLGLLSYALGDKAAARDWYKLALVLDPDEPGLSMNLANALDDLGERAAARAAYEQALARSRRPDLLYNFAVFVAESDPRAALGLLRECLSDPDALHRFGLPAALPLGSLAALGNHEELFGEISRSLDELQPGPLGLEPWSLAKHHARLLSRAGRHDPAVARFEDILRQWPDASADVRFDLGVALVRAGRWERAGEEFAQVDDPMRHFGLAQVHEGTGEAAQAAREYRRFLDQVRDAGHDPIAFLAADSRNNPIARAETFIAAHRADPKGESSEP